GLRPTSRMARLVASVRRGCPPRRVHSPRPSTPASSRRQSVDTLFGSASYSVVVRSQPTSYQDLTTAPCALSFGLSATSRERLCPFSFSCCEPAAHRASLRDLTPRPPPPAPDAHSPAHPENAPVSAHTAPLTHRPAHPPPLATPHLATQHSTRPGHHGPPSPGAHTPAHPQEPPVSAQTAPLPHRPAHPPPLATPHLATQHSTRPGHHGPPRRPPAPHRLGLRSPCRRTAPPPPRNRAPAP